MRALTATPSGDLEVATLDRPVPGPTEVLVRITVAGVNPADWKSLEGPPPGASADAGPPPGPVVPGWDIAGTVVELGMGVTRFAVGDRVFGMPAFPAPASAYAQYTAARSRQLARIPDDVGDLEAGALPLAGLTAWQAVVDTLNVGPGDRVLVHAASGGVGHIALQLAKVRGAEVWVTASQRNHERLIELGADHVIDYRTERFEDVATEMDAVLDLLGEGDNPVRSVASLRRGGRLVQISPFLPPHEVLEAAGVTAQFLLVEPDHAALASMAEMMSNGSLQVVVGASMPLEQMQELHDLGRRGGSFGKLAATVAHDA